MKKDFETFTVEEQIAVERWLTSPKFSSKITITDCDEQSYSYYGLFTNTDWSLGNGDFMVCNFTFQVNGMYAFRSFTETFNGNRHDDPNFPDDITSVDNPFVINLDCQSDELEEFIYPVIKIKALDDGVVGDFKLIPTTDNEISGKYRELSVTSHHSSTTLVLDCQHCIIGEYANGIHDIIKVNPLRYKDLGWNNVGDIYWPRLYPGNNEIEVIGDVEVTISYDAPYKKIGGWLV